MQYNTTRFGTIEVPDEKIIVFESGIIGFENEKKFSILKHKPESSFFWLQSLNTPSLAFLLLFPFEYVLSYKPDLSADELKKLDSDKQEGLEFYCMAVIPKDPSKMTINLLSPVVINPAKHLGIQAVLSDPSYTVNHRLIPESNSQAEKAV